ncbi:MAG: hypothetical protein GXO57_08735 [Thermodesulfobacteria bacterium]|nr:hypothetical protein [Thermodesulfobacteriota bacterium]
MGTKIAFIKIKNATLSLKVKKEKMFSLSIDKVKKYFMLKSNRGGRKEGISLSFPTSTFQNASISDVGKGRSPGPAIYLYKKVLKS